MGNNGMLCSCKECIVRNLIFEHVSVDELTDYCSTKTERSYK